MGLLLLLAPVLFHRLCTSGYLFLTLTSNYGIRNVLERPERCIKENAPLCQLSHPCTRRKHFVDFPSPTEYSVRSANSWSMLGKGHSVSALSGDRFTGGMRQLLRRAGK